MSVPIFEPELNFLPFACECGARFQSRADLDLHQREICKQRFQPGFRENFFLGRGLGIADGGRRA